MRGDNSGATGIYRARLCSDVSRVGAATDELVENQVADAIRSVDRTGQVGTQNEELGAIEHRVPRCAGVDWCVIHCYEGLRTRRYHVGVGEDTADGAAPKNT